MPGSAETTNLQDCSGDARSVPESQRRWQVLSHLRDPRRVSGMTTLPGVGGLPLPVAPPGQADDPQPGVPLPLDAIRVLSREDLPQWVERFRSAAIQADRLTSPDLLAQLDQAARRPIDSVVCNALDPDPLTNLQARLVEQHPDALHSGVLALMRLLGARRGLICLPRSRSSRRALLPVPTSAGVVEPVVRYVENIYPVADPSLLLLEQLRLRLVPRQLPTSVGVVLLDAAAAIALGRFLLTGAPMTRVTLVVVESTTRQGVLVHAPLGSELRSVLEAADVRHAGRRLFVGALLRRCAAEATEIVGPGEQVIHVAATSDGVMPTACTRCGWCADVCPVRALPAGLLEAAQRRDPELADRYGLDACVDCGLCEQLCPSRLPLLRSIRQLRRSVSTLAKGRP